MFICMQKDIWGFVYSGSLSMESDISKAFAKLAHAQAVRIWMLNFEGSEVATRVQLETVTQKSLGCPKQSAVALQDMTCLIAPRV